MTDLTRTVVRGASLASLGHVLTQAVTFASYVALARLAEPRDFGIFAAASVVVGIGMLVADSGLLAAVVARRDAVQEAASTALVAALAGGLLFGGVVVATAPLLGRLFRDDTVTAVAVVLAGTLVLRQGAIVPDAMLQRRFSIARRLVVEPVGAVATAAGAIAGTAAGYGVWGLVVGAYAGFLTQLALSWALAGWRPDLGLVSFRTWRELARFGRHVLLSEGVRRLDSQGRTTIVGRVLGTATLGQYVYATRIAYQPLAILVNGVAYVLMPALVRIADDEERFRAAVVRSLRWAAVAALPLGLVLVPLGEAMVVLAFGERWREAGDAVQALAGVSIGGVLVSVASETWKAAHRPEWLPRTHGLALVLSLGLALALAPQGLAAVGLGLSLAAVATGLFALWGVGRVVGLPWLRLVAELWPPALAAVVAAASAGLLESVLDAGGRSPLAGLPLLAVELGAAAAVYLAALAVVAPGRLREARAALRRRRS